MPVLNSFAFIHAAVSNISIPLQESVIFVEEAAEPRVWVMAMIFGISLFAVAFPGVSKQVAFLRIPHVLFFIGKHFGTGVILATAFIHLLSDAFESLQKPVVKEEYHNIGKWTGLIILGSLLAIFLIEYISTTYVDLLQAHPSPPSTPSNSRPTSPGPSSSSRIPSPNAIANKVSHALNKSSGKPVQVVPAAVPPTSAVDERTPLVHISSPTPTSASPTPAPNESGSPSRRPRLTHVPAATPAGGKRQRARSLSGSGVPYHVHSPHQHASHIHRHSHPHIPPVAALVPIDILTNSPRLIRASQGAYVYTVSAKKGERRHTREMDAEVDLEAEEARSENEEESQIEVKMRIGRRRQVIGILVLQLGIMIHSLVIGLTLSIANGADFASLTTAIIFHQLFEGLSLGIRIAALPGSHSQSSQSSPSSPSSQPSPSTYGSVSHPGCKPNCTDQYTDQRWWHWRRWTSGHKTEFNRLKFTLSILFAITTPLGMGIGMLAFPNSGRGEVGMAHMYLVQGVMSAISAGMLIYAATVEMIAGDFVFGDVEGHSHGHGHGHHEESDDVEEAAMEEDGGASKDSKIKKKILAVISLLAGVGGMVLVGLVE